MTDLASTADSTDVIPIREHQRFDETSLAQWMSANVDGHEGPIRVQQFRGGQSNPTYLVSTPSKSYVLRRQPTGPLLKGAHAVDREAFVQTMLGETQVPVARIYGTCRDPDVIGTMFYLMELVEGRIFWDATFPDVSTADRPAYFQAMNATIADLHGVDPDSIGLGDFGRPTGYVERQIKRLSAQYILRGLITSETGYNTIARVNQVTIRMNFTLTDASGRVLSQTRAENASYSGADTSGMALTLIGEKADEVVAQLYSDYCRAAGS